MADPDDPESLPTQQRSSSEDAASPPMPQLSDSAIEGMLGARNPHTRGGWQPPTPEELQARLPQYEIAELIGRGGMGAVYKGWQKSLERFVAIKILPPDIDTDAVDFAARFKREAKSMARLKHPGIIPVHDAGETADGLLYFVMDYVEGTDVQKMVAARGRLSVEEALGIATHVLDALAYAHQHGIIHRDIKPANIMVDADGRVHVADFGLARSTAADSTMLTVSNMALGTPDFMAPESHLGMDHVDHRADLYAVGVMLYQMLTGKLPRGRFEPLSRAVPGLDKRLDRIMDRTLQPERDARYSSAIELRAELDPVLTRTIARRVATTSSSAKSSGKRPLLLGLGAVVMLAVTGFVLWKNGRTATATNHDRLPGDEALKLAAPQGNRADATPGPPVEPWRDCLAELRSRGSFKNNRVFEDDGSQVRVRSNYDLVLADDASARNGAVRVVWTWPTDSTPSLKLRNLRGATGEPVRDYQAKFDSRTIKLLIHDYADKDDLLLREWNYPDGFDRTAEHTCEFRVVDDLLRIRLDGREIGSVRDRTIDQPGMCVIGLPGETALRELQTLRLDPTGPTELSPKP